MRLVSAGKSDREIVEEFYWRFHAAAGSGRAVRPCRPDRQTPRPRGSAQGLHLGRVVLREFAENH
jgi:ribosomal protein S14